MVSKHQLVVMAAALALASGCTRSLEVKYQPGLAAALAAKSKERVAVIDLVDKRSWVDPADAQSRSFFAKAGTWKFGLTYLGNDYVPVATVVQSLLVADLKSAGFDAFAAKTATPGAYAISGKVMVFEFENETGLVTVTTRRSVSLALTITGKDGAVLGEEALFAENDRENEGMGVMHTTNLDKLLNGAFKKVVGQVAERLNSKLAASGPVALRVSVNGVPVQGEWGAAPLEADAN